MLQGMVHRGPDASGAYAEPGIAAGICRLAVIDLAGGGQPMTNEDGAVQVVFNGEIYNYRELAGQLTGRGHQLRTRSDTEVLAHLWEDDGPAMVQRLEGMFAFCLHDRRTRETFIARDRLGIKPLYYLQKGDALIFASELGVLLKHPDVSPEIDPATLIELFCLQYLAGERTVYRGVRKLLPGHSLHLRDGELRVERYWEIPEAAETEADPERLRELLTDSVRQRMIADVPLGVFLSGGLDSAIVTALVSDLSDHPARTFSLGFDDAAAFDERSHAKLVSDHFGTEHHELVLSPVQIAEHLPALIDHVAEPVMDPAMLPTWLLSQYARQEVTVVLTGEGADELFAGYRRYAYQDRYGWLSRIPGLAQSIRGPAAGFLPRRIEQALEAVGEESPARNHLRWSATIGRAVAAKLFDREMLERSESRTEQHFASYFDSSKIRLRDQLRADQHEWLPHNLLGKVDRASMAHSLEARVPFLDHRLVEWAAGLPDSARLSGGESKVILRRAFADRLPSSILTRRKQGFDLPLAQWMRGPLREVASDLLTRERLARWPGLNADSVTALLDDHLREREDYGLPLFNLLSVMLFLERAN